MPWSGSDPHRPLDGVQVVECGPLLPIPAAGENLRRLGATVTRIDPPGGGLARVLYGGWLHELYGSEKAAVEIDLRTDEGKAEVAQMVATADVVLSGQRPESARRFGLDADTVLAISPSAVYCSIVGFASAGPDASRAGHDLTFLARTAALAEPATPSAVGAGPRRPAIPVGDLSAAAVATQSVLAALISVSQGFPGRAIEVAIDDVVLSWMAPRLGGAVGGQFESALDPANDLYRCGDDKYVVISAIEAKFWRALMEAFKLDLPSDAASWATAERVAHTDLVANAISAACAVRAHDAVIALLDAADVPVGLVETGADVVERIGDDVVAWRQLATPLSPDNWKLPEQS